MTARLELHGAHGYKLDGRKVPGATTVIDVLAKPALVRWAAGIVADHAVDHWDTLADLPLSERGKALRAAPDNRKKEAGIRGKRIHSLAEGLAHGDPVEVPDELRGPVEAIARFLDQWDMETVVNECAVAHTGYRYAGTFDAVVTSPKLHDGQPVMLDYKTGSGIYDEIALQLAAYRYADYACERVPSQPGPRGGKPKRAHELVEIGMPETVAGYGVHVREDVAVLVPTDSDENTWRQFLYALQIQRWKAALRDDPVVFEPVFPETIAGGVW